MPIDIHEIMENWKPGRFKEFVNNVIQNFSESEKPGPSYGKYRFRLKVAEPSKSGFVIRQKEEG